MARKKRKTPITSKVNPDKSRRVPREAVDPDFLSDAELARREAFAAAYCAYGVLAKSAKSAGYKGNDNTLRKQGWRLFGEPAVKARIDEIRADCLSELKITQRRVLGEYARIAFFDIGECFDPNGELRKMGDIPRDTRLALAGYKIVEKSFGEQGDSVEKDVKACSKIDALNKLGAHLKLFKDEGNAGSAGEVSAETFLAVLLAAQNRVREGRRGDGEPST